VPRRPLPPPTRRDIATAAALLVAGIAWGAALAFIESLPVDFGFLVFVLQFGVGLAFIITLVHRLLFRGFHVDRVVAVVALVVGGGALGMEIGPTVPPAVTVVGSYTFTPTLPAAAPPTQGVLACEQRRGGAVGELDLAVEQARAGRATGRVQSRSTCSR
jgi:hypothetical protein